MKLEFIKNVLEFDVDSSKGINSYIIKGMYNEIHEEGFASIVFKEIDNFKMTWTEIDNLGGIHVVNQNLKDKYGI